MVNEVPKMIWGNHLWFGRVPMILRVNIISHCQLVMSLVSHTPTQVYHQANYDLID